MRARSRPPRSAWTARPGGHLDSASDGRLRMLAKAPRARPPPAWLLPLPGLALAAILDHGVSDDWACAHVSRVGLWPPFWVWAW